MAEEQDYNHYDYDQQNSSQHEYQQAAQDEYQNTQQPEYQQNPQHVYQNNQQPEYRQSPQHEYQQTPPTPQSQFSSVRTTPHMSFSPPLGTPGTDAQDSLLYAVNPEQERAMAFNEEIQFRANRSAIGSTGLDSLTTVIEGDTHKEVMEQRYPFKEIVSHPQSTYHSSEIGTYYVPTPEPQHQMNDESVLANINRNRPKKRKVFGMVPVWACIGLIIVVLVGAGLAVGLYLGLHKKSSNNSHSANNQTQVGAFHGSGIATAVTGGQAGQLLLYFQHSSGGIRQMLLNVDGTWSGGDDKSTVASDAKNGTPISTVTYKLGNDSTWHVFYIDSTNIVREKITTDNGANWMPGPIDDLNLTAMDDPNAALQACYGGFWGSSTQNPTTGIHLFFALDAQTQRQVDWNVNETSWTPVGDYTASGRSGVGCYSWGSSSIWYAMFLNLDSYVDIVWRDATGQLNGGNWTNTTLELPQAMANTSMGYTDYFFMQLESGQLQGYNISFNEDNTMLSQEGGTDGQVEINQQPIPGSHFAATHIPLANGEPGDLAVFAQDNAMSIVENIMSGGVNVWNYSDVPIPST